MDIHGDIFDPRLFRSSPAAGLIMMAAVFLSIFVLI
jgi:hypothetical protein